VLWIREQGLLDPAWVVFETAVSTNMVLTLWSRTTWREVAWSSTHEHWKTITFVAALRHDKIVAPIEVDGSMAGETFLAYIGHSSETMWS
jgi:hypothetical protein